MPRHIGHSDDDWTEFLDQVEDALYDFLYGTNSISQSRHKISDLAFSVGSKAYLAGYMAGIKEKAEHNGQKA